MTQMQWHRTQTIYAIPPILMACIPTVVASAPRHTAAACPHTWWDRVEVASCHITRVLPRTGIPCWPASRSAASPPCSCGIHQQSIIHTTAGREPFRYCQRWLWTKPMTTAWVAASLCCFAHNVILWILLFSCLCYAAAINSPCCYTLFCYKTLFIRVVSMTTCRNIILCAWVDGHNVIFGVIISLYLYHLVCSH